MRDLGSPTIPYLPDDNVDRGNLVDGDDPDLAMDIEELFHKIFHGGFSTVWLAQDLKNQRNCAIKIMVSGPFGEHDCQMQTAIRDSVAGISHIVLYEVVFLLRGPQYNHYTFVFPFLGPDVESLVANQLHILALFTECSSRNLNIADTYKILGRPEPMIIDSWKQAELVKPMQFSITLCSNMIYLSDFGIATQVGHPKDGLPPFEYCSPELLHGATPDFP
ncbi:hypothetical protein LOZ51_001147 [Ophidiomyces ophidiicola]|nr:hypothetical protein LOZ54_005186 [Ophidiomyces ophidiicola]KAI2000861.1 hypothetical protein LOZ51_001147 [Ophidiomyces ophidiicola]